MYTYTHNRVTLLGEDKIWGKTRCIFKTPAVEIHHASIEAMTFCSKHYHQCKVNDFYVVSGRLNVRLFETVEGTKIDELIELKVGDRLMVFPYVWHRFEAVTDVELIETYWTEVHVNDIIRKDSGGRFPQPHFHLDRGCE